MHGQSNIKMSGERHAPTVLSPKKITRYPLNSRLAGPQSPSGRCGYAASFTNMLDQTMKITNKMHYIDYLLFQVGSKCFGRCFHLSSGALDCIYSIW
jgi:hypothetical protein